MIIMELLQKENVKNLKKLKKYSQLHVKLDVNLNFKHNLYNLNQNQIKRSKVMKLSMNLMMNECYIIIFYLKKINLIILIELKQVNL